MAKVWFITGTSRGCWTQAALERGDSVAATARNTGSPGRSRRRPRLTEEQARRQIETNLFGPLWVTKAVVPLLREQRAGHIIQVSSIGGVTAFPMLGLYHASKWGLEGFSQSLAAELAEFGVRVTIVEPGGFTTDWSGDSAGRAQDMRPYRRSP